MKKTKARGDMKKTKARRVIKIKYFNAPSQLVVSYKD